MLSKTEIAKKLIRAEYMEKDSKIFSGQAKLYIEGYIKALKTVLEID